MFFNKNVFISHSSANKEIAEHLSAYLIRIGVKEKNIFCSSIIGQGVGNGEKLNDTIAKAIKKSKLIVFLLSRDFLDSSYCMEELGTGWYLNQCKGAICFHLVLPDMELSDLNGFVNSKVDKFSFVDSEQKEELECFAIEVAKHMRLKKLEHQTLVNARKTFFSAIEKHLGDLILKAENKKLEEEVKQKEISNLKDKIEQQAGLIEKQRKEKQIEFEKIEKDKRKIKYRTIEELFFLLGMTDGISKKQFNSLEKQFWVNMLNEYVELEKEFGNLNVSLANVRMQILLANIYSHIECFEDAYKRMLKFIELTENNFYPHFFDNIVLAETNFADEAIELLKNKLKNCPIGIVRDSYQETLKFFEERKRNLLSKQTNI